MGHTCLEDELFFNPETGLGSKGILILYSHAARLLCAQTIETSCFLHCLWHMCSMCIGCMSTIYAIILSAWRALLVPVQEQVTLLPPLCLSQLCSLRIYFPSCHRYYFFCLICWFAIKWLVGWSIPGLVNWLVGCLVGWSVGQSVGRLAGWLPGWLVGWSVG